MKPTDDNSMMMPALRYRDSTIAIEWLCRAFGFEPQLVVPDDNGTIAYTQLKSGNGAIVLIVAKMNESHHVQSPVESGSTGAKSSHIVVVDVDAHYAQAVGAGAEIAIDLQDDEHGRRSYSCRDLEGHIWNFVGSDDPQSV